MRRTGLDGIRGWAAIAVAIYHCILPAGGDTIVSSILNPPISQVHGYYNLGTKLALMVFNGYVAVSMFFLLSGCVLIESLNRSSGSIVVASAKFVLRRLLRLYPLLIAAVVTIAIWFSALHYFWPEIFPQFKPDEIIGNLTLYDPRMIGATWTLKAEVLAIPLLVFCFCLSRAVGSIAFILAALFGVVVLSEPALVLGSDILRSAILYFALGMMIPTAVGRQIVESWGPTRWPLALLFAISARQIFGLANPAGLLAHAFCAFVFIGIVYYGAPSRLDAFLNSRTSQFIGKISFSFYLFCCPVLMTLIYLLPANPGWYRPLEFGFLAAVPVVTSGLIFAYFTERYIEKPAILLGKKLTRVPIPSMPSYVTQYVPSPNVMHSHAR